MDRNFNIKHYEIHTAKLKEGKILRISFLSDLHGVVFKENNAPLIKAVRDFKPDLVLCTGDMMVRSIPGSLKTAWRLLAELQTFSTVYYSAGNHETKMRLSEEHSGAYEKYESALKRKGVLILRNESETFAAGDETIRVTGLEIPMIYYRKPFSPRLGNEGIKELVGNSDRESFQILMGHNPKYGKAYFEWGADLILGGHYHGGVVRLSEHHGLTSPQFLLLPPYCCGDFHKGEQTMLVSAGIGEHTIPVRIHNPRELLQITVHGRRKD